MESLASLFVTLIVAVNAFAPAANLPNKLGVDTSVRAAVLADEDELLPQEALNRIQEAERLRQEAGQNLQERRETALENSLQNREEFQARLQGLRDEKKRKVLENLDRRMTSVFSKWVSHWSDILSRLIKILAKLEVRAERAAESGLDTTAVDEAIANAEATIADAQAALDGLADNDYVFEIGDENNLGQDVKAFLAQFKEDMSQVRDLVKQARDEVHTAFQELRNLISQNENEEE
ncbi:hypothetical protein A2630_01590 [Candidatus Woesebacteria bacterium RIFCSPHIGHO2_01_FULL_44_10]|uniref:DUF5667 domain-containing protein n=1 Tax=Candidatus Woesebacteria bacterium RIFCSPLOWO2_01_FULL_44_14 TaxID=1802525 RepID=A0A1F8C1X6_9BACT|nr:MAG: hypothetical protein A2630_01590 [Candidatus Woesebacteria bacterium RIFCSPHIGHO2_01_FULL_44_10]OGM54946.1 MAG: hypothetical protein A3F62_00890 [Candidatus Woesebacteria bacterium RIFCSPHIGHO2_12_FULL_44_11]OGM70333.1 MAG: hypothetical protein A2975_04675 [Candidatus Woesebacteria bacterium RIFCSPLOWO2_01_FULL_44_14]